MKSIHTRRKVVIAHCQCHVIPLEENSADFKRTLRCPREGTRILDVKGTRLMLCPGHYHNSAIYEDGRVQRAYSKIAYRRQP